MLCAKVIGQGKNKGKECKKNAKYSYEGIFLCGFHIRYINQNDLIELNKSEPKEKDPDLEGEIWKNHPDLEGYLFSNMGRMKLLNGELSQIKPSTTCKRYLCVNINNKSKNVTTFLHKLVAETFLGKHKGLIVNHINGNIYDNKLSNLEFVTKKENCNKKVFPYKGGSSKFTINQLTLDGKFVKEWKSIKEAGTTLGICRTSISSVCRGNLNSSGGYKWEYVKIEFEGEEWKEVDYKGKHFIVSNYGRIKHKTGHVTFGAKSGPGTYLHAQQVLVHDIVCFAFKPNENHGSLVVDHVDNNGRNNHISNLEWITSSENNIRALKFHDTRKPVIKMDLNGNFIQRFGSLAEAAKSMNKSKRLGEACLGNKVAYGFLWKYE